MIQQSAIRWIQLIRPNSKIQAFFVPSKLPNLKERKIIKGVKISIYNAWISAQNKSIIAARFGQTLPLRKWFDLNNSSSVY